MSDEHQELKVIDRRRFIQDGDTIRENPDAPPAPPTPEPKAAEPEPAPAIHAAAEPAAAAQTAGTQPATPPQAAPKPADEQTRRESAQRKADQAAAGLPPADVTTLIEFLAQQVSLYLGEPDPMGRAVQANLPAAGLFIDLLGVLQEKTKGNLALEESQVLDQILYALRLRYVQKRRP